MSTAICERLLTEWSDTYVIMGSRDEHRGTDAVNDLIQSIGGDCQNRLELLVLDTASDDSVRSAAKSLEQKYGDGTLYGIINNAGVRCLQCFCLLLFEYLMLALTSNVTLL